MDKGISKLIYLSYTLNPAQSLHPVLFYCACCCMWLGKFQLA